MPSVNLSGVLAAATSMASATQAERVALRSRFAA